MKHPNDCSFADAYDLFAVNFVNILLGYIYYPDTNLLPVTADTAIKMATAAGTVIGQVGFGRIWSQKGSHENEFPDK